MHAMHMKLLLPADMLSQVDGRLGPEYATQTLQASGMATRAKPNSTSHMASAWMGVDTLLLLTRAITA